MIFNPIYVAWTSFDYLLAPEHQTSFLALRVSAAVINVAPPLLGALPRFRRYATELFWVWFFVWGLFVAPMLAVVGPTFLSYVLGLCVVIFGAGAIPLWRPISVASVSGAIFFAVAVAMAVRAPAASSADLTTAAFFLPTVATIAVVTAWLKHTLTRREFEARQALHLEQETTARLRDAEQARAAELSAALEQLQALDEAKMRFFANVSHELRTPLMLILGPLEQLLEEDQGPARRSLYHAMASNGGRLLRQVNAILDVAKLEAGSLRLELADGNAANVLEDLVRAARPQAERRGISLEVEDLDLIPDSSLDSAKIEVIAANLISNAIKFTPSGGRVVVRGLAIPQRVAFEVTDTGPGIPESELQRIFDRFHQVDASLQREQEGTGLGLALARELARLHEGDVVCESQLGQGATFRVELALTPPAGLPDRRKTHRRRADRMAAIRTDALAAEGYRMRTGRGVLLADIDLVQFDQRAVPIHEAPRDAPLVLLVEDSPGLRALVASQLSRHYRVAVASDGVEGIERAYALRPDAIVTDVMMPNLDGYGMVARLRADPTFARTPILVATAKAGPDAVIEGLRAGANDYVTKPIDQRELRARLDAHLQARRLEGALTERDTRIAAIGRMTREILHDLKNPLSAVLGFASLARDRALDGGSGADVAREIEPVVEQSHRFRRMIEEVLDFARGKAPLLRLEPTPLRDFLQGFLDNHKRDLESSRVALEIDLDLPADLASSIDRDRIVRVLENLLTNAREAILARPYDPGGASSTKDRIVIRAGREGDAVWLSVSDSGPGIPEAIIHSLFDADVTAGKQGGTGLGLATVRNVVRAHGGDVTVEAKGPDGGAEFRLRWPLASALPDKAAG